MIDETQRRQIRETLEGLDGAVSDFQHLRALFTAIIDKVDKVAENVPADGSRAGMQQIRDLAALGDFLTLSRGNDHDVLREESLEILRAFMPPARGAESEDTAHQ